MITAPTRAPAFLRCKVLADDDGVGGHDAALKQPEHGRDDVQRHQPVKRQKQRQPHALQRRAQQQRAHAANAVADHARHQAADDAARQHQRQHLGPARRAKTQVSAIGHDVHLRHRHGDAAGHTRHTQQQLTMQRTQAKRAAAVERQRQGRGTRRDGCHRCRCCIHLHHGRALAHAQSQQQHAHTTHQPQQHIGVAPADQLDAVLHDGRPQRACNVVAAGADRHRNAAPLVPPQRGVGHQRRKRGRCTNQPHQPMGQPKPPDAAREPRPHKPATYGHRAHAQHRHQPMPVGHAPGPDAAQPQAHHHQRVGQRRVGTAHAKLSLHGGQHHRHHIHAAVAQHHQAQCGQQAPCGLAGVDEGCGGGHGGGEGGGLAHAANLPHGSAAACKAVRVIADGRATPCGMI
ncbi:hypothetical protein QF021_004076 [Acidovorax delafieldii]|nr:hypothetical protein [Acidovorax delafieldii]